jgi:TetR/AcrR family transcriptional repressor of nem operon
MGRASRAEAEKHREQIIEAAARMFRERGTSRVSVPDVMAEVGLTHGGFYRHFESKDALAAGACSAAFVRQVARLDDIAARHPDDQEAARADLLDEYLTPEHRDDPGNGCTSAGFASDAARSEPDGTLRAAYTEGVHRIVERMEGLGDRPADDDAREREVLVELATIVGSLVLARATAGDDLSDRILAAAREHLGA